MLRTARLALASALITHSLTSTSATLLGVDYDNESLWSIDTDTGVVTLILDLDEYGPDNQLTPSGSEMLLTDTSGNVYRFNPADGSLIGSTAIAFPPPTIDDDWDTVTAMEYVDDTLYVAFDESGPETGPGLFGTLDPVTGATTEIGPLTGMISPAGGLAYDGSTLYAVSAANSEFSQLFTIDVATGAATLVADITFGGNQVEAMTALVIVDGVAYTKSNDSTGGTNPYYLYSIDLSTGVLTELFDMGQEYMAALTAAPIPTRRAAAAAAPTGPRQVPTMGIWGVGILSGMIGLLGMYHRRRK